MIDTNNLIIRSASKGDLNNLINLYKEVSSLSTEKIFYEIDGKHITEILERSTEKGIMLLLEDDKTKKIYGELHAYKPKGKAVNHIICELSIIIHPLAHGKNLAALMLVYLLTLIKEQYPDVLRVEILVRESNTKGIDFYKSFGFKEEGRFERRYLKPNGELESDVALVWFNPNFKNKYEIS